MILRSHREYRDGADMPRTSHADVMEILDDKMREIRALLKEAGYNGINDEITLSYPQPGMSSDLQLHWKDNPRSVPVDSDVPVLHFTSKINTLIGNLIGIRAGLQMTSDLAKTSEALKNVSDDAEHLATLMHLVTEKG